MSLTTPQTILICAANPADQEELTLDHEVRGIQEGLRHSREQFEVRQQWATRPQDLRRALLDYRPAYVHFCGHGAGDDGLVLEEHLASAEALAGLFKLFAETTKCVVLNACYSSIQAIAIAEHIQYVIGMNKEIGDSAAIAFTSAFYDALGAGESVEFAFELGRNAIQMIGLPEHLTPELLTRAGRIAGTTPTLARGHRDWDGGPSVEHLYGRDEVAEQVRRWIVDDSCRVVLITGMRGIGKTDLVMALGRGGVRNVDRSSALAAGLANQFERVLWRSLLNAPMLDDLLTDMLDVLSDDNRSRGAPAGRRMEEVLSSLQRRRCLVILDNLETILAPGDPTRRYLDGYESYGGFFEMVAKSDHQSCIVLTSREKPRVIAELEGARKRVRSLSLTGINVEEAKTLFAQISTFHGNDDEWTEIATLYGGNPLALELAARHIDEVFAGELSAYLHRDRRLFDDLKDLLDWHLDRLSGAERELVDWLAVQREPATVVTLTDDMVPQRTSDRVASTLQSLQRRIPLERTALFFTLQPVLIEHLTAKLVDRISESFLEAIKSSDQRSALDLMMKLNSLTLAKATAKEHVLESQLRLIVTPITEQISHFSSHELLATLQRLLDVWRQAGTAGYAVGNLIHLFSRLEIDLHSIDFSGLHVWQAPLNAVSLHETNFAFADFRHTTFRQGFGTVFSLAYSPDNQFIATGDDNGEIRVFFSASGQLHLRCSGHVENVQAVRFSPDGQTIASGSFDHTIRLWSMKDGHCITVLTGHNSWIYSLAFSPDGRTLASASEDGTCRIWDLATGCGRIVHSEHDAFMAAVAFSPDGKWLATGGTSCCVLLFPADDLKHPRRLEGHNGRIRALAFSPHGDLLASGAEDSQVIVWRASEGTRVTTFAGHTSGVMGLSFSPTGNTLASVSYDQTVRLWSTSRSEPIGQLYVSAARVWAVECSPDGRTAVTASEDNAVRVWDMESRRQLLSMRGYSNKTWALAFLSEGARLVAGNEDGIVRIWDTESARTTLELRGHANRIWAVACSPDGAWICSASDDGTVRLWDAKSGSCRHVMRGHRDWIRAVAFDPTSQIVASAAEDGNICLWDVETGSHLARIDSRMPRVLSVAFCENGKTIAAGGSASGVHLFSVDTGEFLDVLPGHIRWLISVVPYGASLLASCSEDNTIRIWDVTTRTLIRTLDAGCRVLCGAFLDGGRSFLSGSEDGLLRRWNIEDGTCEREIRTHRLSVWSLAVNAAGDCVATAGDDGAIRLRQLPSLAPLKFPDGLRSSRPYEAMNITGVTGLTSEQKDALTALGAIELPES
jgi:WD40 repeat protein